MSQIKSDLICEIIRVSQTNFLGKRAFDPNGDMGEENPGIIDWIQKNAASYRRHFMAKLESFSLTELSELLKELRQAKKDLFEVFEEAPAELVKKKAV
jgi:hypothetical protein